MVEWKKLVSVANVLYGYPFESSLFSEDSNYMPLIRIRDVKPAKASTYYSGEIREEYRIKKGDTLVGMDGEFNLGRWDDRDGLLNQRVLKISGKNGCSIDGYLFHYMGPVFKKIEKETAGGSVKHLSAKVINNILIPIPSLSEQSRIVSILDTFTSSISNLKQQIEERRKQYEYERDLLLDLEGKEGVEMKKLEECVLFITDGDHQPPPKSSEGIPFVTISDIEKLSHTIDFSNTFFVPQEYYNSLKSDKKAKKGDVLYTVTGSFGIPVLIEDNREFCFQRHIALIRPNNTIALSRYIYHWLCSNYAKKQGEEKASGGAQKTVSLNSLRSFRFYYPPLQAQSRIVSILDTFEQSIANLEEQLAMREKQYEYYRNQLLTFEGEEERGKT